MSVIFFIEPSLYLQFHSTSLTCTHSDPLDPLLPHAVVAILHSITELLYSNLYVVVLALDFSSLKHLIQSAMQYYFKRLLCLTFRMLYTIGWSTFSRNEGTVRGMAAPYRRCWTSPPVLFKGRSAVGPVSYVINAGDLATVVQGNRTHKYADDTYIIITANK